MEEKEDTRERGKMGTGRERGRDGRSEVGREGKEEERKDLVRSKG